MAKGETYEEFVAKFKPKKTTDDCYTPPGVFGAVLAWACREYGIDPARVVRPFYPGGDYERADYPEGCCVVDNPPFSILAGIVRFYAERGIRFFLFAPTLTCMNIRRCSKVVAGAPVVYENGARVNTSFVTNLDPCELRSAPGLRFEIVEAQRLPPEGAQARYEYPDELVTGPTLARMSKCGVEFGVRPAECAFVRALDAQRAVGKSIYGGGYLIGAEATSRRRAAEHEVTEGGGRKEPRWRAETLPLSAREKEAVGRLLA